MSLFIKQNKRRIAFEVLIKLFEENIKSSNEHMQLNIKIRIIYN